MTWHQKLPLCPFLSLLPVTSPKVMTKFKHHRLVMPAFNFMKTESYRNHSFVSGYCKSTLHLWDSSMMMHVTIICSVLLHVIYYHVHLISCVWLFATPWTAAHQASLSFTVSQSLLKLMSTESMMPSNHFILCRPLLLLPSLFPSIGVFPNESGVCIRWAKYWNFNFSISPSKEYTG